MKFLDYDIGNYKLPLYIAELGCNHKGQFNELLKQIEVASWHGADAVKIQCYEPDSLTCDNGYIIKEGTWKGRNLHDIYKHTKTPHEWMKPVFEFAKTKNIHLFSSVYDLKSLEVLEDAGCSAYKIASFEAHNPYFVKRVSLTGKPLIISTGMMSIQEIKSSFEAISLDHQRNVCLLHCVSSYPSELYKTALGRMQRLQASFIETPIGFSDHTNGIHAPAIATALGAAVIEKHFSGVYDQIMIEPTEDDTFSIGPTQFRKMVRLCNHTYETINQLSAHGEETELRSSLHIVNEVKKGDTIQEYHLQCLRPNSGEHPNKLQLIIGKISKVDIAPGTPFLMEYVDDNV